MLKVLRNFVIGLLLGTIVCALVLPYALFEKNPGDYYAHIINGHLRQNQNYKQLARFFEDDGKHLPILTYRHFVDEDAEGNPLGDGITLSQFETQMQTLSDIGCTFITPATLLDAIQNGTDLPKRAVLITFDDCSEDIYTKAYPILQKYEINATVNLIGYYTEYRANYDTPLLSWKEVREMKASGLIDFQSETYYSYVPQFSVDGTTIHPFVDTQQDESQEDYVARVTKDLLMNNIKLLAETGEMPIALAYPHGEYNDSTTAIMQSVGLSLGFESATNVCLDLSEAVDPYHLPRFEMDQNFEKMKEFIVYITSY
ncbi:MAG: polysaccharide deacetylase family protein [Peptococcaceae bacterium]|nr:polysaccharide deacetylase family protein [Peptococcaceae bacterium]